MDDKWYTQKGVEEIRLRIQALIERGARQEGVRLDSYPAVWFDGSSAMPSKGEPWKVEVSSSRMKASESFPPDELGDYMEGLLSGVPGKVRRMVAALKR